MKLKKVLVGLLTMVFVLSSLVGTAFAKGQVNTLPFSFPDDENDLWVKLIGGGEMISTADVAAKVKTAEVTFEGNATFDGVLVYNSNDGGWVQNDYPGQTVNGSLVLTMPMDGTVGSQWCEIVVFVNNLNGDLKVTQMQFKDEAGNVVLTHGAASAPAAAEEVAATEAPAKAPAASTPKTGVVGFGAIYGIGALLLASGAVALKKKQK
jgi:hypothetical protein